MSIVLAPQFQSRPEHGKGKAGLKHHFDRGSDNDFCDRADWNRASYTPDLLAEFGEPLSDAVNGYRQAAIYHLQLMFAVDDFVTAAEDARLRSRSSWGGRRPAA